MGPLAVTVSLVRLEWHTVTAVIMAFINVPKITDRQTVQTEGQLKYSQYELLI
jgi:hypothetical protein